MYKSCKRRFLFVPRRMSTNQGCGAENICSLVTQHVPKATLSRAHEAELTFTLPFESMDTFSGPVAHIIRVKLTCGAL